MRSARAATARAPQLTIFRPASSAAHQRFQLAFDRAFRLLAGTRQRVRGLHRVERHQRADRIAAAVPDYAGLSFAALAQIHEQWPIVGRGDVYYGGTTYDNHQGLGVQLSSAAERGEPVSLSWPQLPSLDIPENALLAVPVTLLYSNRRACDVAWLGDFDWALPAVGLVGIWVLLGFCIVLLLTGMTKVDPALYESARIDGAGWFQEFVAITVPLLRYEIGVCLTVTVIAALAAFDIVYVATAGGPGNSTAVPGIQIYVLAFTQRAIGLASALAVMLMILVVVVISPIQRLSRESTL